MSTSEKDYSSYLAYESMGVQVLALFCGFTFTAITIFITLLPNPSSFSAQATLFFLSFMFYLFEFLLFFSLFYLGYTVKTRPPEIKGRMYDIAVWLWLLSFSLWGISLVLMFLLWNLTILALASGIVYAVFTFMAAIYVWKPTLELYRKAKSSLKE